MTLDETHYSELLTPLAANDQAIVNLHATGLSQQRVARKLGVGKKRVSKLLNRLGLCRRSPAIPRVPVVSAELVTEVLRLYGDEKISYHIVASITGISASQCRRVVKFYKPEIARTRQEQQELSGPIWGHDFRPSDLGLRKHKHACASCGIKFVVPIDMQDMKGRECGICQYCKTTP